MTTIGSQAGFAFAVTAGITERDERVRVEPVVPETVEARYLLSDTCVWASGIRDVEVNGSVLPGRASDTRPSQVTRPDMGSRTHKHTLASPRRNGAVGKCPRRAPV